MEEQSLYLAARAAWEVECQALAELRREIYLQSFREVAGRKGLKIVAVGDHPGTARYPLSEEITPALEISRHDDELEQVRPLFKEYLGETDDDRIREHLTHLKPLRADDLLDPLAFRRFMLDHKEKRLRRLSANIKELAPTISQLEKMTNDPMQLPSVREVFKRSIKDLTRQRDYCTAYVRVLKQLSKDEPTPYVQTDIPSRRKLRDDGRVPPFLDESVNYAWSLFAPPQSSSRAEAARRALSILQVLYPRTFKKVTVKAILHRVRKL